MRDETCFKDGSAEVHRCYIYQILIGGQTRFSTTGPAEPNDTRDSSIHDKAIWTKPASRVAGK